MGRQALPLPERVPPALHWGATRPAVYDERIQHYLNVYKNPHPPGEVEEVAKRSPLEALLTVDQRSPNVRPKLHEIIKTLSRYPLDDHDARAGAAVAPRDFEHKIAEAEEREGELRKEYPRVAGHIDAALDELLKLVAETHVAPRQYLEKDWQEDRDAELKSVGDAYEEYRWSQLTHGEKLREWLEKYQRKISIGVGIAAVVATVGFGIVSLVYESDLEAKPSIAAYQGSGVQVNQLTAEELLAAEENGKHIMVDADRHIVLKDAVDSSKRITGYDYEGNDLPKEQEGTAFIAKRDAVLRTTIQDGTTSREVAVKINVVQDSGWGRYSNRESKNTPISAYVLPENVERLATGVQKATAELTLEDEQEGTPEYDQLRPATTVAASGGELRAQIRDASGKVLAEFDPKTGVTTKVNPSLERIAKQEGESAFRVGALNDYDGEQFSTRKYGVPAPPQKGGSTLDDLADARADPLSNPLTIPLPENTRKALDAYRGALFVGRKAINQQTRDTFDGVTMYFSSVGTKELVDTPEEREALSGQRKMIAEDLDAITSTLSDIRTDAKHTNIDAKTRTALHTFLGQSEGYRKTLEQYLDQQLAPPPAEEGGADAPAEPRSGTPLGTGAAGRETTVRKTIPLPLAAAFASGTGFQYAFTDTNGQTIAAGSVVQGNEAQYQSYAVPGTARSLSMQAQDGGKKYGVYAYAYAGGTSLNPPGKKPWKQPAASATVPLPENADAVYAVAHGKVKKYGHSWWRNDSPKKDQERGRMKGIRKALRDPQANFAELSRVAQVHPEFTIARFTLDDRIAEGTVTNTGSANASLPHPYTGNARVGVDKGLFDNFGKGKFHDVPKTNFAALPPGTQQNIQQQFAPLGIPPAAWQSAMVRPVTPIRSGTSIAVEGQGRSYLLPAYARQTATGWQFELGDKPAQFHRAWLPERLFHRQGKPLTKAKHAEKAARKSGWTTDSIGGEKGMRKFKIGKGEKMATGNGFPPTTDFFIRLEDATGQITDELPVKLMKGKKQKVPGSNLLYLNGQWHVLPEGIGAGAQHAA